MTKKFAVTINAGNYEKRNRFVYKFNNPVPIKNGKLSVDTYSVYNFNFNITEALGNNKIRIEHPVNATFIGRNITIPDGYYNVETLQQFLELEMLKARFYLLKNGEPVYYFKLSMSETDYTITLTLNLVPNNAERVAQGLERPPQNALGEPTVSKTPRVVFTSFLHRLLGFEFTLNSRLPGSISTWVLTRTSTTMPRLNPISNFILCSNLLSNSLSSIPDIFFSIPMEKEYGELITGQPMENAKLDIQDGIYTELDIRFFDQKLNPVTIRDTDICLTLLIETE